jgi:hypothetical protein
MTTNQTPSYNRGDEVISYYNGLDKPLRGEVVHVEDMVAFVVWEDGTHDEVLFRELSEMALQRRGEVA